MPKPIVCLSEQLCQFLEAFRTCFSRRQWKYFVTVLLGLIECEERRTLSGLLRGVAERISLSGCSRFLSRSPWSADEVAAVWQRRFRERMEPSVQSEHAELKSARPTRRGRPKPTVVTGYLIFDDSVHIKPKGRRMAGLGWHYSNTEKRVVSGHCLFTGLYQLQGQRCPLPARLYRQQVVCQAEQVAFQSKIDLAISEIAAFEPVAETQTHVLVDSWFHTKRVRQAAQKRGWEFSGGLKSNRVMRLIDPEGRREWLPLSEYAARLGPTDWQDIVWPSAQGGQPMYAHLIVTWIRKLGPTLLMITCHDLEQPLQSVRYWGSTLLDQTAQEMADRLAIRWEVETFFEYEKDLLGSDHYQLMTAQAIVRFWNLIACMMCFLEEQRTLDEEVPLTCGEVRRRVQQEHRQNLLKWLEEQFREGQSVEQIGGQLAIFGC